MFVVRLLVVWAGLVALRQLAHRCGQRLQLAPDVVARWTHSQTDGLSYAFFAVWGWSVVRQEDWLGFPDQWFQDQPLSPVADRFYAWYLARYGAELLMTLGLYHRRDRGVLLAHHVLVLACLAGVPTLSRFFLVLMPVTDLLDPCLHAAKLCVYSGYTAASQVCFGAFAVVFVVTRLGFYGFAVVGLWRHCPDCTAVARALCLTLYALQWYWAGLLARAIGRQCRQQPLQDERSDAE